MAKPRIVIRCAASATEAINRIIASSPKAYVEMRTAIKAIELYGFAGEARVAILNHQFNVFLVEPPSPGQHMVIVHDPARGPEAVIANVGRFLVRTEQQRRRLATDAANTLNLPVADIQVMWG